MTYRLTLSALALVGCFTPDLSNTRFRCSREQPQCPENAYCDTEGGCCRYSFDPACSSMTLTDGGMPQPTADMTMSEPPDMTPAWLDHCKRIVAGSEDLLGCSGIFAKGGAKFLCPAGYAIAKIDQPVETRKPCMETQNAQTFLLDIVQYRQPGQPGNYGTCQPMTGWPIAFAACMSTVKAWQTYGACMNWPFAAVCDYGGSPFHCEGTTLADVSNTDPSSGVMCQRIGSML